MFSHRAVDARPATRGRARRRRGGAARPAASAGAAARAAPAHVGGSGAGARRGRPARACAPGSASSRARNPMLVAGADRRRRPAPHREPRRPPAPRLPRHRPGPGQEQRVPTASLDGVIDRALAEDAGRGDPTTDATVPAELDGDRRRRRPRAGSRLRPRGRARGGAAARPGRRDGGARRRRRRASTEAPRTVARIEGSARALLTAERTALNLLQRLSGIATATRRYVTRSRAPAPRSSTRARPRPGLRRLDKLAVACGGGTNHRAGSRRRDPDQGQPRRGRRRRRPRPSAPRAPPIRTCTCRPRPTRSTSSTKPSPRAPTASCSTTCASADLRAGGRAARPAAIRLEASGGITLETVRAIAETGVDAISIGALTHSVRALDISLEVHPCPR